MLYSERAAHCCHMRENKTCKKIRKIFYVQIYSRYPIKLISIVLLKFVIEI